MAKKQAEQYGAKESEKRFKEALRGAFKTPPKPLKDVPKARKESQSNKQKPGK